MTPYIDVYSVQGSSASKGKIQPVIGMDTNLGRITYISGQVLTIGSGTSQGRFQKYYWDGVGIEYTSAEVYGHPTGVFSLVVGQDTHLPKNPPSGTANFTTYLHDGGHVPQSYDKGG